VSVIGLGRERDKDAELLKDVARRGKGRVFFTDKPEELPRLFAQDTFVVARNTFIDEPTGIRTTPALATLTERTFRAPAGLSIGGYNLCYLRPGATLGTVTLDEYGAPVVAAWRVGSGRAVCYTGEADGKYAGEIRRWGEVGHYFTSLARWAAGPAGPLRDNMLLTQEVREGVNVVELHLDPERKGEPFAGLPKVTTLRSQAGGAPRAVKSALRWTAPDTLGVEVPLEGGETALTAVDVPGHGAVSLPPVCLPYSPEFRPAEGERGLQALERLGRAFEAAAGANARQAAEQAALADETQRIMASLAEATSRLAATIDLARTPDGAAPHAQHPAEAARSEGEAIADLGLMYRLRYEQSGNPRDLELAIQYTDEALDRFRRAGKSPPRG
jgi:hypothetical protein